MSTGALNAYLQRSNAKQSQRLREIPRELWPEHASKSLMRVLRSRYFLVQEYEAPLPALVRLSVNRTELSGNRWSDGISWIELQEIKAQCGYSGALAFEVFPPDRDEVNAANMRHLWVMSALHDYPFVWRNR